MGYNDSNLSQQSTKSEEKPPLKQHHLMATGKKIDGQTNPFGANKGPTDHKIGNDRKNY